VAIESRMYNALTTSVTLRGYVGDRIYPITMRQGTDYPAVVYKRDSGERIWNITGQPPRASVQMAPTANCTDPDNDQNVTTGWDPYPTVNPAILTSEPDGAGGYCLRILEDGGAWPWARHEPIPFTKGRQYKISYEVRAGTANQYRVHSNHDGALRPVDLVRTATANWVRHDLYFTATATSNGRLAVQNQAEAGDGTYLEFNNVSLTPVPEITENAHFEVSIYATAVTARRLTSDAVIGAISSATAFTALVIASPVDAYNDEVGLYQRTYDISAWNRE